MTDHLFESIDPNTDYNDICQRVLYQENESKLSDEYTEGEFISLNLSTKKRVFDDLKLNFKFILTFGASITAFFPIVESFIINARIDDIQLDRTTVIYLSICALAISFDNPKETYRKLFSELRLRNVYGLLEDLTKFIEGLVGIFNYVVSKVGKITYDIIGMFNYTALFVPFALTISTVLSSNKISLEVITSAMGEDGLMKLTSMVIGVTGITLREFISITIKDLLKFNFQKVRKYLSRSFRGIENRVKKSISDIRKSVDIKEIDRDLKSREVSDEFESTPIILKWDQWKEENDLPDGIERIDEVK